MSEDYLLIFLKRDESLDDSVVLGCKTCPNKLPKCNCGKNQQCKQITRTCTKCAHIECIGGLEHNVGGIVGGVIGSVAFLVLIALFVIRSRRKHQRLNRVMKLEKQLELQEKTETEKLLEPEVIGLEEVLEDPKRKKQRSTKSRSIHLMASSALSRASNIIPVTYSPGAMLQRNLQSTTFGTPLQTHTAVRAVPKLVNTQSFREEPERSVSLSLGENYAKQNLKSLTKNQRDTIGLTHIVEDEDDFSIISEEIEPRRAPPKVFIDSKRFSEVLLEGAVERVVVDVNPFDDTNALK